MAINVKALLAKATPLTRERADELIAEDMAKNGYTARYGPFKNGTETVESVESSKDGSRRRNTSKRSEKSKLFEATFGNVKEGMHMPRSARDSKTNAELKDARAEHFIHVAVGAAILVEPEGVDEWLKVPDAELGRQFKNRLWKAAGIAAAYNLDLPSLQAEGEALQRRAKQYSKRRVSEQEDSSEDAERYALVRQGKFLSVPDYCRAAGIKVGRLQKELAAQRVFSVNIGAEQYVPSVFLSGLFERKAIAKVVRRLERMSGWEKYLFLTTALELHGGATPLQLLMAGSLKTVLNAADVRAALSTNDAQS
ncbi:protein of unknown function [Pararobbsia alpina]|uniref:hypothetical protein n=1 Tax=Pararobbsia alpina TaxID=621374 RepID=UPI0039A4C946